MKKYCEGVEELGIRTDRVAVIDMRKYKAG